MVFLHSSVLLLGHRVSGFIMGTIIAQLNLNLQKREVGWESLFSTFLNLLVI